MKNLSFSTKNRKGQSAAHVSLCVTKLGVDWLNERGNVDPSPCVALVQTQVNHWST